MGNNLANYNPIFYAQEGLLALEAALGMAGRVYRNLDDSQSTREKGDTASIRVPGSFVAQDAPSAAQDIDTTKVDLKFDQWKEVKFALTDKELSYTGQQIIDEHIKPAAYALAYKIDQVLCGEYVNVPWIATWSNPVVVTDITGARAKMFNNLVDLQSDPSKLNAMVSGTIEGELLSLAAFSQNQGSGADGVNTQMSGHLGRRYGLNFFANQNVKSHTSATVADVAGTINNGAGYAKGATTINFNNVSANAAFKAGDVLVISGHTQQYVLTADIVASAGGAVTGATIFGSPFVAKGGLEAAVVDTQVITVTLSGGSGATKEQDLFFHQGFLALGMAKLPDFYNGNGVQVFSVARPESKLALRARTWVDGNNSKFYVALDCLFGLKTLDGNKAIRVIR